MTTSTRHIAMLVGLVGLAALGLAACGGDDDGGEVSDGTDSGAAVSVQTIDGTDVLVDAQGRALYSADQEQGGRVKCTGSCTSIWDPVPASGADSAASDLGLGEVERPDGSTQLALEGRPLYTFTEEGAGELTGDGVVDSFDGTRFSWSAATTGESGSSSSGDDSSAGAPGY